MQKGKSLEDKCFLFSFLYLPTMTLLPLEAVYTFHKGEQEVVFSMMKNGIHVYLLFFFFFSIIEEFLYTLCIKLKSLTSMRGDINEDDRVDLIEINSPEVDEIR